MLEDRGLVATPRISYEWFKEQRIDALRFIIQSRQRAIDKMKRRGTVADIKCIEELRVERYYAKQALYEKRHPIED